MSRSNLYADLGDLPGRLFVVEGIDGSGKSTQLDLLRRWLIAKGYCVAFSEWNSSPLVRDTTRYGKAKRLLTPLTFSLIHAADFADRLDRTILPPLRAGAIVLVDRYIYTAYVRDAARGIDREYIRRMYRFAPRPTAAFFFKVPLPEALKRILAGRPQLKF
jgi:dTMP kinase